MSIRPKHVLGGAAVAAVLLVAGVAGDALVFSRAPESIPAPGGFITPAEARSARPRVTYGAPAGQFDHYVLALSWSPAFCEREGQRKGRSQCAPGRRHGFVVHGLWPQYAGGGYPAECAAAPRQPTRMALDIAAGVFPDEGLARHEWRRHGVCSGDPPADYFRNVKRARDAVAIPEAYGNPSRPLRATAMELKRAFAAANPGLRPDMIDVVCRRGALQEVRICFSRDLRRFQSCNDSGPPRCRSAFVVQPPM
ncbi:ribonuclease T [Camelimonas abortus]|uniref:Ribonuclease T n=1 Tax=Camelimonas abortus TaxID=1017184 RepID=A0ABV7LBC7_9HYPH